jgi:hypothetical protein
MPVVTEYAKVDLGFLESAPIRIELTTTLPVSAAALFRCFEDPDGWHWAGIDKVHWETPKPYGQGTTRTIDIASQGMVQEFFLRWEQDHRFTFRFERGEVPLFSAFMEDYLVDDRGGEQCQFTWTIALGLRGIGRFFTPIARFIVKRQFTNMLAALSRDMATRADSRGAP